MDIFIEYVLFSLLFALFAGTGLSAIVMSLLGSKLSDSFFRILITITILSGTGMVAWLFLDSRLTP